LQVLIIVSRILLQPSTVIDRRSVDNREVLHSLTIDTPELVPPGKERGIDAKVSQVSLHIVHGHGVVTVLPETDILPLD